MFNYHNHHTASSQPSSVPSSTSITESLSQIICNQETDFSNYDIDEVKARVAEVKIEKEERLCQELEEINGIVDGKMQRILELSKEKGCGAWLTSLPIQSLGYTLNKQEFRDSVCLRYGWNIQKHTQLLSVQSREQY